MSRKLLPILCVALIAGGVACGDDDDNTAGDAGPDGSPGANADSGAPMKDAGNDGGGTGGTGTGMGTGGMSAADAGNPYQCEPPAPEPGGKKTAGEACCGGLGVCTAHASGPGSNGYGLDNCVAGKNLKCVPVVPASDTDAGDDDGGTAGPVASCRVDLPKNLGNFDLEGRCIPGCFVTGDPSSANLGRSSCDKGSKCVPCYSPITGKSTGACNQGGDSPVEAAPPGFAKCGDSNAGYCVSMATIAASGNVMLPQLTCKDGDVCAPKVKVLDQKACFAHCDSMIGGPGACIASYIVPDMTRALLQQSTCSDGEICAPCISPLDKTATGACR